MPTAAVPLTLMDRSNGMGRIDQTRIGQQTGADPGR